MIPCLDQIREGGTRRENSLDPRSLAAIFRMLILPFFSDSRHANSRHRSQWSEILLADFDDISEIDDLAIIVSGLDPLQLFE